MNLDERDLIADQFGVAPGQVERDHLISLLLAHLSANFADRLIFIGGTALARTHLPSGRLSEDIDLIAGGSRSELAHDLDRALPRSAQRSYGQLTWKPTLSSVRDTGTANLVSTNGVSIKMQLLSPTGRPTWPTELRPLEQRYTDAAPATLRVPTRPAFVAAKTIAWCDRAAPRDLWDLGALNDLGAIDHTAAQLFRQYGPTNNQRRAWSFLTPPSEDECAPSSPAKLGYPSPPVTP